MRFLKRKPAESVSCTVVRAEVLPVVYALIRGGCVYLVHAFKKTTRTTSPRNIEIAGKRLKEILR
jgi:phage-related protein